VQRVEQISVRFGVRLVEIESADRRSHVAAEFLAVDHPVRIGLSRARQWGRSGLRAMDDDVPR
jgi:hypothetical protein